MALKKIDPEEIYELDDLAPFLKVTTRTLRRYVKKGELPAKKIGHSYKVLGHAVYSFMGMPTIVTKEMQPTSTMTPEGKVIENE